MKFEFSHVAEMVRCSACGIAAGEIHKVEHGGILAVRAPVLRKAREQVGVKGQPLLRSRILAEQSRVEFLGEFGGGADRKSTRLNSSHRCISYAVFCLKK